MHAPTFIREHALTVEGYTVIGVDEAGCGCLAGPVVAAAAYVPLDSRLGGIRDSKLISAAQRERCVEDLRRCGAVWAVGIASHEEVDRVNIRQATYMAMERAVRAFLRASSDVERYRDSYRHTASSNGSDVRRQTFDDTGSDAVPRTTTPAPFALVDAWTIPNLPIPQRGIIHGDRLVKSIAAASIIAKVTRDAMMVALDAQYPAYGFAVHKGYATTAHRAAIAAHGVSPVHRRTFTVRI